MASTNDKTLDSYNKGLNKYIEDTHKAVTESEKIWIDKALSYIPNNGRVL